MPTYRKLVLRAGVAAGVSALALGGTVASYAAPAPSGAAAGSAAKPAASSGVVPPTTAPHRGVVAGLRTGPTISIGNPSSLHAFRVLHAQLRSTVTGQPAGATPATIHENVGTSFDADTVGSQATQSVSTKIKPADPNTTLYTPTMYPSGGSCIEMSTAYFHTSQVVAAWDWCKAITFVADVKIDKSFMRTYTHHHNYSTQILQTDAASNTWTSYLYNYKTKAWEKFFRQNGTSQVGLDEGWDIYELYSTLDPNGQSYACADLEGKRVEAKGIKVGVDGHLVRATPARAGNDYDVPLSDFHCSSLTYSMISAYSHWEAIG